MSKNKFFLVLMIFGYMGVAQTHQLDRDNSGLTVTGTSSLHDWEVVVQVFDVSAFISQDTVKNVIFNATPMSITGGKSMMDKDIQKALKTDQQTKITFDANVLIISNGRLTGAGELTIAGVTNTIPIDLAYVIGDRIQVMGQLNIKLTEYNIAPPTAMFGLLKTGDEITIKIHFTIIE